MLGTGLVDPLTPVLHPDDLGLTRGDGCFEATRVRTDRRRQPSGGPPARTPGPAGRLVRRPGPAAGRPRRVAAADREVLVSWRHPGEAMLKLMLSRGRESQPGGPITGLVTLTTMSPETLRQRRDGVDAITLSRGVSSDRLRRGPLVAGRGEDAVLRGQRGRQPGGGAPGRAGRGLHQHRRLPAGGADRDAGLADRRPAGHHPLGRHRRAGLDHPAGVVRRRPSGTAC